MKKFFKLVAVVLAIAVIICPMMSVVSHATTTGGYKIEAIDANNLKLTINSTDGFIAYHATVGFNSNAAFQSSYTDADATTGYKNGLKVISYTLKTAQQNPNNKPAISAEASGNSLNVIVMPSDINNLDLCTEIVIGIRVADGTTASLTKIQAADNGADVTADPTLLSFPAAGSDGVIDSTAQDYIASNATTNAHTHSFTQQTQTAAYLRTDPTCTADATYWYSCATCGLASSTEYFTATGTKIAHTPNHTKTFAKDPATCTTDATYYDECSECHQQLDTFWTENNTALGHNMTHHDSVSSTCKVQGNIEYYYCSRCEKFFADENGAHELTEEETKRALAAHTPSNTKKFLKSAATCGDDAIYYQECSVCGEQLNTTWTDLGSHNDVDHTFGEYVSDGNATCAVDGTKTRTCSVCKATETVTDTGSHLLVAHTVVNDAAVAATCTATGLSAGSHCSVCGAVITAQTVVPALGHDFATYTSNGSGKHTATCTRCDATDTQDCNTNGNDGACSVCGYKATPAEPVVDNLIEWRDPTFVIAQKTDIELNIRKARLQTYDHYDFVVVPTKYSNVTSNAYNKYVADPIVLTDISNPTGKNAKYIYNDVAMYELGLMIDCYARCYDSSNNIVATSTHLYLVPATELVSMANNPYTINKTKVVVTDLLNMAAASQAYFVSLYGSSDLATDVEINGYVNAGLETQELATVDYGTLDTTNDPTWFSGAPLNSSDNKITPVVSVGAQPTASIQIKRIRDLSADSFRFNVSYQSNKSGTALYSHDYSLSDFTFSGTAKTGTLKLNEVAYYDTNVTVTMTLYYQDQECCQYAYSIESGIAANMDGATGVLGDLLNKVAIFGASARNYISS